MPNLIIGACPLRSESDRRRVNCDPPIRATSGLMRREQLVVAPLIVGMSISRPLLDRVQKL